MKTVSFKIFLVLWNTVQQQQTPMVHLRVAGWLEGAYRNDRKRLLLMAFRACGKSTLVGLFCAWLLYINSSYRILVVAADLGLARKMVRNVKRIIERHPLTQSLRPDNPDQWGADRFTLNRSVELRDPSMLAKGVTTNLTGTRADIIICDDVEVPNTCDTASKREDLRIKLAELDFILTPGGTMLYVGTPHTYYTLYHHSPRPEIGEDVAFLAGFDRLVVPLVNARGLSNWPERYPDDEIAALRRRTGPHRFASQMQCQPMNIAESRLDPACLQPYAAELVYQEAGRTPQLSLCDRRLMSASAWWDPAFGRQGNDRSVLAILFTDQAGDYWLHDVLYIPPQGVDGAEADEATRQCRLVAAALAKYYVPSVALEINGLGRFLPGILRRELAAQNVPCAVREISNRRPKDARILEAFDAVMAARALHVHSRVLSGPFPREMAEWNPQRAGNHDDGLDAVAGAISLEPIRLSRLATTRPGASWRGVQPHRVTDA